MRFGCGLVVGIPGRRMKQLSVGVTMLNDPLCSSTSTLKLYSSFDSSIRRLRGRMESAVFEVILDLYLIPTLNTLIYGCLSSIALSYFVFVLLFIFIENTIIPCYFRPQ